MILIDTSAWIEFFRRHGDPGVRNRVAAYIDLDEAAYTCPVLFELLVGARDAREAGLVREALGLCRRLFFAPEYWEAAASTEKRLRERGVKVPRDDVLVATTALEVGVPVLCKDRHFDLIRDKGDRKLVVEQVAG